MCAHIKQALVVLLLTLLWAEVCIANPSDTTLTYGVMMQMAFNSDKHGTERGFDGRNRMSAAERSFKSTREFYQPPAGTTLPVERFRHDKPNYDKPNDDKKRLHEADFCDRCGIDGNEVDGMHYCWPCWERRIETVSHMSCIDRDELLWLHGNEDERHWRCIKCR